MAYFQGLAKELKLDLPEQKDELALADKYCLPHILT